MTSQSSTRPHMDDLGRRDDTWTDVSLQDVEDGDKPDGL